MSTSPAAVIVLAAGEGTRMKSAIPKVMHEIGGRSLVGHAVAAAGSLEPEVLAVVVGHGRDRVSEHVTAVAPDVRIAVQDKQLGTGHAVACALEELPALDGTVVVTYGDVPLLAGETLRELVDRHVGSGNAVTVLTALLNEPHGYGRILRDERGDVTAIVEQKDATPDVQAIKEINSGIYAFDAAFLRDGLARLGTDNAQGELYLTDLIGLARMDSLGTGGYESADRWQTEGVNDRVQLAAMGRELNRRIAERWMREGVTIVDPETTWIDVTVELEADVVLRPGTQLHGTTTVAEGAQVGPETTLTDCVVGAGASVVRAHAEDAELGPGSSVGPFAFLRPGTRLAARAKAGAHVEIKASTLGEGAKAPHVSYIGDATIGSGANVGAGTIVVNYDGLAKHHTTVGKGSFVGSNSSLIAPVDVADGSYIAAGSAVTEDVEPGEIAVARARQRNVAGWVARKRAGTRTANAAEDAQAAGARHTGDLTGEAGHGAGEGR